MIYGIGSDICVISRIEKTLARFGQRFERRCFTQIEQAKANRTPANKAASYAKRFAAKEAFSKAMGTGVQFGVAWNEIGVQNDALGKPNIVLSGKTKVKFEEKIPNGYKANIFLTMSDDYPYAISYVIIELLEI
jgi:holo-[acyl-carrier protein] synthase